jgi:putative FmdB family regulatory protein
MPLFEYTCKKCDHQFETLVMGSTKPVCPKCNSAKLEKMLSTFAVSSNGGTDPQSTMGACGSCGDSRGPGACAWDN